jgi:DNA recombination protein RmuC
MYVPAMDIVFAIVALVIGLGLGWFFGNRPLAEWQARFAQRDAEAKDLDGKFREAIVNLAAEAEKARRAGDLAQELAAVRENREAIRAELATLKANAVHFDAQQRTLLEAQELLKKEFENAGNKVLERAQEVFLQRADKQLAQSEEKNAERIRTLLAPVG